MTVSCGHSDSFRVKGSLVQGESINLRLVYYSGGNVHTALTASTDGKFEFEGSAPELTAVEVYDNEYRPLARFLASNGQDIDLRIDRRNSYKNSIGGNDYNRAVSRFFNENADALSAPSSPARNRLVARFVENNSDNPASFLLIATEIDASSETGRILADSLLSMINADTHSVDINLPFAEMTRRVGSRKAREPLQPITYKARGNHNETFVPSRKALNVVSVSDATHGRDSVLAALHRLAPHLIRGNLDILDLSVDADTAAWVRSIRNDSASWSQGWVAGSISGQALDRLGVPSVPFFIIADSTGRQIWRGTSAAEAVSRTIENSK